MHWHYDRDGNSISMEEWSRLFMQGEEYRRVALAEIDDVEVSTVWIGIDHNFLGVGPPVYFETMIFGGPYSEWCWRWPNQHAALAGHDQIAEAIRRGENPSEVREPSERGNGD